MNRQTRWNRLIAAILLILVIAGCAPSPQPLPGPDGTTAPTKVNNLRILADYQIESTFGNTGIVKACERETGVGISIEYKSSTSVRVENTNAGSGKYDAFWATSTVFLPNLPIQPIYTAKSYIVVGASPSVASKLQWDPNYLRVVDVLNGIPSGDVKLLMTDPSQSDPASSFFLAVASVMAGETMLTSDGISRLPRQQIQSYFGNLKGTTDNVETFKGEVLRDLKEKTGKYNSYVMFEATLIQINKELVKAGIEPIHAYYLADATTGAKFPIVLTSGNPAKEAFDKFVACVRSEEQAPKLQEAGYRTETSGYSMEKAVPKVFNKDWGIDATMPDLPLVDYPRADVTMAALRLYRDAFKPKVRLGLILDRSQSMDDNRGWEQLLQATDIIFDQKLAAEQGITIGPDDAYSVFVFETKVHYLGTVYGNDPDSVTAMATKIRSQDYNGYTNMFDAVNDAFGLILKDPESNFYDANYPDFDPSYVCAMYVMTDGVSNRGQSWEQFKGYYDSIPTKFNITQDQRCKIYGVGFGNVDVNGGPFVEMVNHSGGIVKDGRQDLKEALKGLFNNLLK